VLGWGWGFLPPSDVDSGVIHAALVSLAESRVVRNTFGSLCSFIPWLGWGLMLAASCSSSGIGGAFEDGGCWIPRLGGGLLPAAPCSSSVIGGPLGGIGCALDALAGMELRCDGGNKELELFKGWKLCPL